MGKLVTVQNLTTSKSGWEITILCLLSRIFQTEILEWCVGTGTYIAVLMMSIYLQKRTTYHLPDRSRFAIFIKE